MSTTPTLGSIESTNRQGLKGRNAHLFLFFFVSISIHTREEERGGERVSRRLLLLLFVIVVIVELVDILSLSYLLFVLFIHLLFSLSLFFLSFALSSHSPSSFYSSDKHIHTHTPAHLLSFIFHTFCTSFSQQLFDTSFVSIPCITPRQP